MTRQALDPAVGRTVSRSTRLRVFYGSILVIALLLAQRHPAAAQDQEPALRAMTLILL